MATACLRLVTLRPDEDFNLPRRYSPITFLTFFCFLVGTTYLGDNFGEVRAGRFPPGDGRCRTER